MRYISGLLLLTLLLSVATQRVTAQAYWVQWNFNGADGVDMSSTSGSGPIVPTPAMVAFDEPINSVGVGQGATTGWAPAIDDYFPGVFFEFTFTISDPVSYTVDAITFYAGASGAGATHFQLRSSADDYNLILGTGETNAAGPTTFNNLNLGGSVGEPFTFRISGIGGTSGAFNGFSVDDVTVSGMAGASPIPEPSSMAALMGLGVMGWSLMRRRPARLA